MRGTPVWSLTDRIKEVWRKAEGPLLILLGAGIAAAGTYAASVEDLGPSRYLITAGSYIGAAQMVRNGIGSIRFWYSVYRDVHESVQRQEERRTVGTPDQLP